MRLMSAFDRRALVATTAIVVLPPARGAAARVRARRERSSARASASALPSAVRTPATTLPVAGSMMSPTAFTATMAPTIEAVRQRDAGRADAALHRAPAPPILPTVAPAPAPTLPSGTGAVAGGRRGLVAAVGGRADLRVAAEAEVEQDRGRHDRHHAGGAHVPADLPLLEIAHDALRGVEAVGAAARQHDRVDLVDHVERIEQIGLARARRAAALRHAAHGALAVDEHHGAAGRPLGQREVADADARHVRDAAVHERRARRRRPATVRAPATVAAMARAAVASRRRAELISVCRIMRAACRERCR